MKKHFFVISLILMSLQLQCDCKSILQSENIEESTLYLDGAISEFNLSDRESEKPIEKKAKAKCVNGETRPCYTGRGYIMPPCKKGKQTCLKGEWSKCEGEIIPQIEICNGIDDDCDGKIDSPTPASVPCYTGPPKTENVGDCQPGYKTCFKGVLLACTNQKAPTTEVCDSKDNDCDGSVDEDNVCAYNPSTKETTTIKEGEFVLGTSNDDEPFAHGFETPPVKTYLSQFKIDKYLVTNENYKDCVSSGGCTEPLILEEDFKRNPKFPKDYLKNNKYSLYPVVGVTWRQARTYCIWMNKELPTEAQWERSAKTKPMEYQRFPWGNYVPTDCSHANTSVRLQNESFSPCYFSPSKIGAFQKDQTVNKTFDMIGNVREWTSDCFSVNWYKSSTYFKDPRNNFCETGSQPLAVERTVRGGSFRTRLTQSRITYRSPAMGNRSYIDIGFRCAR
jgi:formylglycine-generating enzyme required for sulfatase activity